MILGVPETFLGVPEIISGVPEIVLGVPENISGSAIFNKINQFNIIIGKQMQYRSMAVGAQASPLAVSVVF